MRPALLLAVASCLAYLLTINPASAQGQKMLEGPTFASVATSNEPAADPNPTDMVVLAGKITNPAGVLPGAVIILTATKQMAVTNADGEFQFVVPASAGILQARVTYAGYADEKMILNATADESTVSLTDAVVIVVSRKQQLKTYLKTARKQARRSLRQLRK